MEGARRKLTGANRWIFILFTWAAILVTIYNVFRMRIFWDQVMIDRAFIALLAALLLPLVFLLFPATKKSPRDRVPWYDLILAALSILGPAFNFIFALKIMESDWSINPPPVAFVLGLLTWALVIEGMRRSAGWILAAFIGLFSILPLFANYLPGALEGKGYSLSRLVGYHYVSHLGIFGLPMDIFGTILIGFMIFGVALEATGAGKFLIDMAQSLVGRVRGGPALVAVVASALLASLSGSSVANVISTGTVTIPAMKKIGYQPHVAAAIETCASTGGPLTPPVMGATAFIMASFLEIPYAWVCIAAAIPMFIYYVSMFTQVYFYAQRRKIPALPASEIPSFWGTLKWGWFYLGSIVVLVILLFYVHVEAWAPYYATGFLILCSLVRKETRPNLGTFFKFTKGTGETLTQLAPQLAGVGMVIGALALTGLGESIAGILVKLGHANVFIIMFMGAIGAMILGLGFTTTPVYIFMALVFAPALVDIGVVPIAAHFFFLYWGVMSEITPPVGFPFYVAAAIAEAPVMKTGWYSMRMGLVRYLIPFMFVLNPVLVAQGSVLQIIEAVATAGIGVILMGAATENYLFRIGQLNKVVRVILFVAGLLLVYPNSLSSAIGGAVAVLTILAYLISRKLVARAAKQPAPIEKAGGS